MKTRKEHTVSKIYRNRYVPHLLALLVISGFILFIWGLPVLDDQTDINPLAVKVVTIMFHIAFPMNIVMFIGIVLVRAAYRRNPICPTCGIDAVDCKINRNTILPHYTWAE